MSDAFGCAEVTRFVDAYLDGEFATPDASALEHHLGECAGCAGRVRFQAEFRAALRGAVPTMSASSELRARIQAALDRAPAPSPLRRQAARVVPALAAAAAAVALVAGLGPRLFVAEPPVVADAIARHQRNWPIEVADSDPERVRAWFADKVDFAVHPPRLPPGYRFRGARLANVGDRQAAYLVYDRDGDKVSVLVFDASEQALPGRRCRLIAPDRKVCLGGERGYNVAFYRDRDIGYAFTSDMDEDHMVQLVSTSVPR